MKLMTTYGAEPTVLKLSDHAQQIFDSCNDLTINEVYDGKGDVLGYSIYGQIQTLCLTAEEVEEVLDLLPHNNHQ